MASTLQLAVLSSVLLWHCVLISHHREAGQGCLAPQNHASGGVPMQGCLSLVANMSCSICALYLPEARSHQLAVLSSVLLWHCMSLLPMTEEQGRDVLLPRIMQCLQSCLQRCLSLATDMLFPSLYFLVLRRGMPCFAMQCSSSPAASTIFSSLYNLFCFHLLHRPSAACPTRS